VILLQRRPDARTPACARVRVLAKGALLAGSLILGACGQRGPLYLPEEAATEVRQTTPAQTQPQGQPTTPAPPTPPAQPTTPPPGTTPPQTTTPPGTTPPQTTTPSDTTPSPGTTTPQDESSDKDDAQPAPRPQSGQPPANEPR